VQNGEQYHTPAASGVLIKWTDQRCTVPIAKHNNAYTLSSTKLFQNIC
jgi:hypothetical protein